MQLDELRTLPRTSMLYTLGEADPLSLSSLSLGAEGHQPARKLCYLDVDSGRTNTEHRFRRFSDWYRLRVHLVTANTKIIVSSLAR